MSSPYLGLPVDKWRSVTEELVQSHPLAKEELVEVTLACWDAIFATKIGGRAQIGVHIFPRPQIMGTFLHELIPLEFSDRYPGLWRREETAGEKDLVFVPDATHSIEIKTSSSKSKIFGNRSYAQHGELEKKDKSGYYLGINFDKFKSIGVRPSIHRIYFGWLDGSDWIGQAAPTGQQARLSKEIYGNKLLVIHPI